MNLNGKNVLITGVTGFVGSEMAKYLVDGGVNVFGLMRRRADGSISKNLKELGIKNKIKLIEGDLEDIHNTPSLDECNPDVIFHFASQSFVPRSFLNPLETLRTNCMGTSNLLEAVRIKDIDPTIIFAGSSEEYGLVISSKDQYKKIIGKYGIIFPEPEQIPELPIKEENPLRPMSPYAVSKVCGDYLMRNYYHSYGMKTIVSRAFNHEGARRGLMFVTSVITSQIMKLKFDRIKKITIGNVNAFRDWSSVKDALKGYVLLSEKGRYGDIYNQGSERTNSVLSYILLSLECAGYQIDKIETIDGRKKIEDPAEVNHSKRFGTTFEMTKVDRMALEGELEYELSDKGIVVYTDKGKVMIEFDEERFRPAEVPILLSNTEKIQKLGFELQYRLQDIIKDQLNYFMKGI